jgi:hypothetical protein
MDYKYISERIALLTQEIRDLQRIELSDSNHRINRTTHEQRELRLKQIKEELSRMMPRPIQRDLEGEGLWESANAAQAYSQT